MCYKLVKDNGVRVGGRGGGVGEGGVEG